MLVLAVCTSSGLAQDTAASSELHPINQAWTKQYDLSKVPNKPLRPVGSGTCKTSNCGPDECDKCFESCGNCPVKDDVYGCGAGQWALTFDDGPSNFTTQLLDILAAAKVKATFLMVGSNVVKYPEVVKRAYDEGHQISQHTWSHPHLMSISNEQIVAEVRATEEAIFNVTGARTAFIRPPYGEADDRVKGVFKAMGYYNLLWNMDTLDWDIVAKKQDPDNILNSFKNVLAKGTDLNPFNNPGYISLQHDLYVETVKRVPSIEQLLEQKNFHFVLAHECINVSPYQNIAQQDTKTATPTTEAHASSSKATSPTHDTVAVQGVSGAPGLSQPGVMVALVLFISSAIFSC
ncbi:glycoside hydrolase/deacetylase [Basidiobolus meristosporus CBS 931.73]|uniref:Glycoside hydrolase/deacetylase n=1 Tax=Basidiobolus meristosporus CBS 931.73 TaxID=1314790 RepID=A0A1Y1YZJ2_9FUNG|nr:glycoside hydrolase/deacetylase [Basidiobolus meristosporus CBS 931.73]|eukprot:ORY03284.1 glycoside hydrolase/deacetylase [Basidiobolus meristosporus CBS 931.73]